MTTDIERAAFEVYYRRKVGLPVGTHISTFRSGVYELPLVQATWQGWQARASRPVVVTDEMVEAGARALYGQRHSIDYWHETASTQRGDDYRLNARRVLSAALNGGTDG